MCSNIACPEPNTAIPVDIDAPRPPPTIIGFLDPGIEARDIRFLEAPPGCRPGLHESFTEFRLMMEAMADSSAMNASVGWPVNANVDVPLAPTIARHTFVQIITRNPTRYLSVFIAST
jgi:hypothetical protein